MTPAEVVWPPASSTIVSTTAAGIGLVGVPSLVAGILVAAQRVRRGLGNAAETVRMEVLDRAATTAAGVSGVLVRLTRADGGAVSGQFGLSMDYAGFADAFGGNFGSRLRWMSVPSCALSTPEAPECRVWTDVASTNDQAVQTVSGILSAAPDPAASVGGPEDGGGLYALTAAPSGGSGDFSQTSLAPSASWTAGTPGGEFSWTYPLRVPPGVGGPVPDLSIRYSSNSVDGRTLSSNSQPSWVGEGFELWPGYIERRYRPCNEDGGPSSYKDLCWWNDNLTVSLGGSAQRAFKDDTTGAWRLQNDPGWRIEHLNGSYETQNRDNDREYWKVTTPDGVQYFFGKTTRYDGDTMDTQSVLTVPVFGDDSGEPCHSTSGFNSSWCVQAWRWNLDYIVDPHGNSLTYQYLRQWQRYGMRNNALVADYDRAADIATIWYGTRAGSEASTNAPARVDFAVVYRCTSPSTCTFSQTSLWPDTPWDQYCSINATSCPNLVSPAFWTGNKLSSITTRVWNAGSSSYRSVDSWALNSGFPDNPDGTSAALWLWDVTQTGQAGASAITLPSVHFDGVALANQVVTSTGTPFDHFRVNQITTETGELIRVYYSGPGCTTSAFPSDQAWNNLRCFPQKVTGGSTLTWWNKYKVDIVEEIDQTGGGPTISTSYDYSLAGSSGPGPGQVLWHEEGYDATKAIWDDWRGYTSVTTTRGTGTVKSKTSSLYFRGMHADSTGSGTRSVSLTNAESTTVNDWSVWRGQLWQTQVWDGTSARMQTFHDLWQTQTADQTTPDFNGESWIVRDLNTRTKTWIARTSSWRTTQVGTTSFDTEAYPLARKDFGDTSTPFDDACTTISYARNTSAWIMSLPAQTETTECGSSTPIAGTRTFYDGSTTLGEPPTRGLTTRVDVFSAVTPSITYAVQSRAAYDAQGRITSSWDALDRQTTTAYTPSSGGPLTRIAVTNPASFLTTTTYDPAWGLPTQAVDANNKTTIGQYDALGRLVKVWLHNRPTSATPDAEYAYAVNKTVPSTVAAKAISPSGGQITSYQIYDSLLRLRQAQTPVAVALGGRWISDTRYDERGHTAKTSAFYNVSGPSSALVSFADTAVKNQHRFTYDALDRSTVDALFSQNVSQWQASTAYDGDQTTVTPPAGGTATTTFRDAHNRTTVLRQYLGAVPSGSSQDTSYSYDLLGRMTTMSDVAGNTWVYTRDERGRIVITTDPDKGQSFATYDNAGQLRTTLDARGVTLAYAYDNLGRKTSVWQDAVSTGTKLAEWTYDTLALGQLTSSTRYDSGNAYTTAITGYDNAYRSLGSTTTFPAVEGTLSTAGPWTTSETYNVDGSVATVSYPGGGGLSAETVTNGYDANGFLLTVTGASTYVSDTSYHPWGDVYQRVLGSGTKRIRLTSTVDETTLRLTTSTVETENQTTPNTWVNVRIDGYGYNPAGAMAAIKEQVGSTLVANQCFQYDGLQRLTEAWTTAAATCQATPSQVNVGGTASYWTSYSYSNIGNRTQQIRHFTAGNTTTSYTYPAAHTPHPHALSSAGGDTYGYDSVGNMTSRNVSGTSQTLTWNPEGHLATHIIDGQATSFVYAADGARLLRKDPSGNVTAYLGGFEVQKAAGGTLSATRFYGDIATRTSAGLTWTASDHHGTAQVAVNSTSLAVTTRRFMPFGETRSAATIWPNEHGYVNGTSDPTGLTHLGIREYDPNIGRFISVDPIQDLSDPQQWNGYAYADNNPVTRSDSSGSKPCDIGDDCAKSTYSNTGATQPNATTIAVSSATEFEIESGSDGTAIYSINGIKLQEGDVKDPIVMAHAVDSLALQAGEGVPNDIATVMLLMKICNEASNFCSPDFWTFLGEAAQRLADVYVATQFDKYQTMSIYTPSAAGDRVGRDRPYVPYWLTRTKTGDLSTHLTEKDLTGAQRELRGEVVAWNRVKGRPYDHIDEVRNAQRGVLNRIGTIQRRLSQRLDPVERATLTAELSYASKLLDYSEKYLPRVPGV